MKQQLLSEIPKKTQEHIRRRETNPNSTPSFHGGIHSLGQLQQTLGNRNVTKLIQAKQLTAKGNIVGLQRKLTVGAADDQYEQEANRVASQVINTPDAAIANSMQRVTAPEEDQDKILQTKPLSRSITPFVHRQPEAEKEEPIQSKAAGSMADSFEEENNVETQINQSKGGGSPLPDPVRAYMEPRFGLDFSHVRVHTGSDAIQMTRDVRAQAFTYGSDVYFGAGSSPNNLELTAHELTHVVQQTGGAQLRTKKHAAEPSIQRAIETMGGKWHTTKYDLVRQEKDRMVTGVDIELNFTPEDPVEAELIGLTQTVRGIRKGSPRFIEDSSKRRATSADVKGVEEGFHIDQPTKANPLYATGETKPDDTLASTPIEPPGISVTGEVRDHGQHGWHFHDATGTQHQDAILIDKPLFRDPAKNSSQTFETTALAIKGRQEGTYYGSVRWGWETNSSGNLTKIPLSVIAAGVPSATFMRAAELWNAATTSNGTATIDLPTSKLPASAKLPANRNTAGLVIEIARVNKDLASMSPGTDKTNKEFEKAALEFILSKRPDKPTISFADQEKAAAELSTLDLLKRAIDLPEEIWKLRGEPWLGPTTNKELEMEANDREIRKRQLFIKVYVHETEDVFSDNVYVKASSGVKKWKSPVVKLNNGDENTFIAPLSLVYPDLSEHPASSPVTIEAYDEDVEGDDLMFTKDWHWSDLPIGDKQSRGGGNYTVWISFAQP